MPKQKTEHLVELIHSLSKAEKRSFRLFAGRLGVADEKRYLLLFDFIESRKDFREDVLLEKNPSIKKSQLPNLKAVLYDQLLSTLRRLDKNNFEDIAARDCIDNARILLSRGLPKAAQESLEKAKKYALAIHNQPLLYHVHDFERTIENQMPGATNFTKSNLIKKQGDDLVQNLITQNEYSNLSISLYSLYLKNGYVKDQNDYHYIDHFFRSHLPQTNPRNLDFYEKVYYYQCHVWYHHMIQDFAGYYKYAQKWVDCFEADPRMITADTSLYLKGMHNALNALYMADKKEKFKTYLLKYKTFGEQNLTKWSETDRSHFHQYFYLHQLNYIFLTGNYQIKNPELKTLEHLLKKNDYDWEESRVMVLYYKLGCVYFGADDYDGALTCLNQIINAPNSKIRQDIQCFARILALIVHYELGNEVLLSHQIRSVFRFLSNMEDLQGVQREILSFLRKTPALVPSDIKKEFVALRNRLVPYSTHPYEKRPFLYLDIIAWLDAKINGTTIREEIQKKR